MKDTLIVKIGRTLKEGKSVMDATKEAWRLKLETAQNLKYIIGYDNLKEKRIIQCFKIEGVEMFVSDTSSNRVKFELSEVDEKLDYKLREKANQFDLKFRSALKLI